MNVLPYLVCAWLFLIGLYGVSTSRNFIHLIMSLLVMQSSTYVFLLAVGYIKGAKAPIYADVDSGTRAVDPVTHALVLTDIVVGTTVTGLLLAIAVQVWKERGTLDPAELRPLRKDG
jgi:multicomponent Na+:H+ antiporter subunit C